MQLWRFTNVSYEPNGPSIRNNTDGFINLNGMFFYNNKIITPYVGLYATVATDFKKVGAPLEFQRQDMPLTTRLFFEGKVNTDKECILGMRYIISPNFSLKVHTIAIGCDADISLG